MKLLDIIRRSKWDLGIALEIEGHRYDNPQWNFHVIKAPYDRWFADPFILDVTADKIYLLCEELEHRTNKGRLAKLTIDKSDYKVIDVKIILDLPTHLSFPAICRHGCDIYIYPENSAAGECIIYKYDKSSENVIPFVQLSNLPLTDAVMFDYKDSHYMCSTKQPCQNGDTLYVFSAHEKISFYSEIQRIKLKDNTARSAGDFFDDGERIIRPAQNCNDGYGKGLVFQKINIDDSGNFSIEEMFRKSPLWGYTGMHTYNTYKGYAVIDLHKKRYPRLYRFFQMIKQLFCGNTSIL